MARPRKPAAIQKLSGAWEKNPSRKREEFDAGELGDVPAHFDAQHKTVWHELRDMFPEGVLQRTDRWAMERVVCLVVQARTMGDDFPVGKEGHLGSYLGRMGMTPADRSKVDLGKQKDEPEDDFEYLN